MANKPQDITVRNPRIEYGKGICRYYLRDNSFMSHLLSGLNLQFPEGEEFFVQSVAKFARGVEDPVLKSEIQGFCGQEMQHRNQHGQLIGQLEQQGYRLKGILNYLRWFHRKLLRSFPASFQLAYTVGCEHFTATLSHAALKNNMLEGADLPVRNLFLWHAIEEMEHKNVAFDVFSTLRIKNYFLRMAGYFFGAAEIFGISFLMMFLLIRQDFKSRRLDFKRLKRDAVQLVRDRDFVNFWKDFLLLLLKFLKPRFHPNQIEDQKLMDRFMPEVRRFTEPLASLAQNGL